MRPLRTIFLYSAHHLGSAIVLNAIADCPHLEIAGVIGGRALPPTKDGQIRRVGLKQARRVGPRFALTLYSHHLVQRWALTFAGAVNPHRGHGLLPCERLADQRRWRRHITANVNSSETAAFIEDLAPDLMVSAFFGQIVDKRIFSLPRLGTLNLHPGWLPAYRGAMSYVWALLNAEHMGGATLHWMDETIDTGPIVARSRFALPPDITVNRLMITTAFSGAQLITETSARLAAGELVEPIDVASEDVGYYTTPVLGDVHGLLKQNRYYHLKDIASAVWQGADGMLQPEAIQQPR